jgi:hypothetical protein
VPKLAREGGRQKLRAAGASYRLGADINQARTSSVTTIARATKPATFG